MHGNYCKIVTKEVGGKEGFSNGTSFMFFFLCNKIRRIQGNEEFFF
jgi:hypothetical protein